MAIINTAKLPKCQNNISKQQKTTDIIDMVSDLWQPHEHLSCFELSILPSLFDPYLYIMLYKLPIPDKIKKKYIPVSNFQQHTSSLVNLLSISVMLATGHFTTITINYVCIFIIFLIQYDFNYQNFLTCFDFSYNSI